MNSKTGRCEKCGNVNAYTSLNCTVCGARLPWADAVQSTQAPAPLPPQHTFSQPSSNTGSLGTIGGLMMIAGIMAGLYFFLFFDVSVQVPTQEIFGVTVGGGRVANLDLMNQRQNGIIFSFGIAILGAILTAVNSRTTVTNDDAQDPKRKAINLGIAAVVGVAGIIVILYLLTLSGPRLEPGFKTEREKFRESINAISTTT